MREPLRECRFKGITDGHDLRAFEHLKEWAGNSGKEMRVLVGVDVSDGDAGLLESVDLGLSLSLDVGLTDAAAKQSLDKVHQGGAEGFSIGTEQGGNGLGR